MILSDVEFFLVFCRGCYSWWCCWCCRGNSFVPNWYNKNSTSSRLKLSVFLFIFSSFSLIAGLSGIIWDWILHGTDWNKFHLVFYNLGTFLFWIIMANWSWWKLGSSWWRKDQFERTLFWIDRKSCWCLAVSSLFYLSFWKPFILTFYSNDACKLISYRKSASLSKDMHVDLCYNWFTSAWEHTLENGNFPSVR